MYVVSGDRACFVNAAERIGRRLCRDAIWHEGRCGWLGWSMEPHAGQWASVYRAVVGDLYGGTSGIGLFLAKLYHVTEDRIVRRTAEAAFAQALTTVDRLAASGEYGFYSGLSGIAWACREAGMLLDNDFLTAQGDAALLAAANIAPNRLRVDVINGSAGLILALIAVGRSRDELLAAAVRHGEHLVDLAVRAEHGWSWDTLGMPNERHLLGFAHGASGIACALAALAKTVGPERFLAAARGGLRYERNYFRPAEGNWPDLRSFVQPVAGNAAPCMLAWCHGAPGIGFARLQIGQLMPDETGVFGEAETAIATTLRALSNAGIGNLSLCHGDGGNADMLLLAADLFNRQELRDQVEAVGLRAMDRFEAPDLPWPCGVPNAGETPSLMLGLAGIGYFFLRLYDSKTNASVMLPGGCFKV
jgi:lantibiotic biosynthesis protein